MELDGSPVRYVVRHHVGPAWRDDLAPTEQPGAEHHFGYMKELAQAGKLLLAGPFLSKNGGGMAILRPGLSEDEARAIGAQDPAVVSGLITAEVLPWLVTLEPGAVA